MGTKILFIFNEIAHLIRSQLETPLTFTILETLHIAFYGYNDSTSRENTSHFNRLDCVIHRADPHIDQLVFDRAGSDSKQSDSIQVACSLSPIPNEIRY